MLRILMLFAHSLLLCEEGIVTFPCLASIVNLWERCTIRKNLLRAKSLHAAVPTTQEPVLKRQIKTQLGTTKKRLKLSGVTFDPRTVQIELLFNRCSYKLLKEWTKKLNLSSSSSSSSSSTSSSSSSSSSSENESSHSDVDTGETRIVRILSCKVVFSLFYSKRSMWLKIPIGIFSSWLGMLQYGKDRSS
jgi:hypothetical protein